ncbi:hypothetical protein GCM10010495_64330 [Kitasatospora herbaricolor]|nr:hypothetical protein GCM10010495_64330 [Kitasatospora herbaricolor]
MLMGTEARLLRHDGIRAVARAARASETTFPVWTGWSPGRSRGVGCAGPAAGASTLPRWTRDY